MVRDQVVRAPLDHQKHVARLVQRPDMHHNGESNAQSSAVMKSRKPVAAFQAERKSCQPWRSTTMVGGIVVITLHLSQSCEVSMLNCDPFGTYRGVPKIFELRPEA